MITSLKKKLLKNINERDILKNTVQYVSFIMEKSDVANFSVSITRLFSSFAHTAAQPAVPK